MWVRSLARTGSRENQSTVFDDWIDWWLGTAGQRLRRSAWTATGSHSTGPVRRTSRSRSGSATRHGVKDVLSLGLFCRVVPR